MAKEQKNLNELPEIHPYFPQFIEGGGLSDQMKKGKSILQKFFGKKFLEMPLESRKQWINSNLPIIKWDAPAFAPEILTIYFLCSPTQEVKAEKVLIDLIRKWAIPEKEVNIVSFFNMHFYLSWFNSRLFFLAKIKILVEDGRDLIKIQDNLPILSNEIALSLSSVKYLETVLDTKALSLDQKSGQIQLYLRKLAERSPANFDVEIFKEMSIFFALSNPEFRKFRLPKHLTRIVVSHHLMRKTILHHLSVSPEKRHLEFRFIRSKLHFPFGSKSVLGLSIALGITDRYETFEDTHIVNAIQKFIPNAQVIKGSYYFNRSNYESIKYLYLELEKKNGSHFTLAEIRLLKRDLKEELKKRIERLIPSIFMIRNEEEVMRNILLLSQELKLLSDIPQIMVNFEKQDADELYFTVLVLRVLKKSDLPLGELFAKVKEIFRFLPDRVQNVGYVRKKNPKEANVFHLCIPKEKSILRADSSFNYYLARQKVVSIITAALGEVRDYNGGMILKQGELFSQFKHAFSGFVQKDQELLEDFFFALSPIEAQATTPLQSLKSLFKLFLEATEQDLTKKDSYFHKTVKKQNTIFAIVRFKEKSLDEFLSDELSHLENFPKSLIKTQVEYQGTLLQGFIYENVNAKELNHFEKCIRSAINKWVTKVINEQELRLSFLDTPLSLDPRVGGDEIASTIIKLLFEGLTRIGQNSKPTLALAKSIEISQDLKRYEFKLRPSVWSDGTPLIAYDFEYAWKKILSPSFYTPFAYFFYPIKNAKAAKEGKLPLDKVGVKAINESTLVVDLENPTSEFLELISHGLYSPVNHRLEQLHPDWAQSGESIYVCNGPMKLIKTLANGGFEFIKNPCYWDAKNIKLNRVHITKSNSETALAMYKNNEIDWIGHPMRPWEPYFSEIKDQVSHTKSLGTHWCVFNTMRYPFDQLKMRRAFYLAIDREELVKDLPNNPLAATTPLPQIHSCIQDKKLIHGNRKLSLQLFEEALKEVGLTRKNFPILTFCYTGGKMRGEVAERLVKRWEEVLGITCRLEEYEFHTLFPKMIKGDFQLGSITWKSWINDPIYTLSAFQYRTNRTNFSKWENPQYQELIDQAQREMNPENRFKLFKRAEEILLEECPVLPINYEVYRFMHKKELKNAFCSDSGNIDFKWSSIVPS